MGDITIRFRMDVTTGQKDITVEYQADDDALPHEHEKRHREIVGQLIGTGAISADEASTVRVERLKAPTAKSRDNVGLSGDGQAVRA